MGDLLGNEVELFEEFESALLCSSLVDQVHCDSSLPEVEHPPILDVSLQDLVRLHIEISA